ncbi:MAG: preprotein translocase subunit SecY [Ruminococcus sp.]|jgi:preprotein translocase subunit SecY|nr:preprotein translocase subunit SecY [Ruminococcus sp.]
MFSAIRNAFAMPELRRKIIFTLVMVLIFRMGCYVPVPFLDPSMLANLIEGSGSVMNIMDTFSGGALSQGSFFALSYQPYINASIVMQLLTYALPVLENLQKEGETGQKKIQRITNFVSLGIALAMSYAYYATVRNLGAVQYTEGFAGVFTAIIIILTFTAGAQLITWMGNQINARGIGQGISVLLFAGIVSRGPSVVWNMFVAAAATPTLYIAIFFVVVFFVFMIGFIVFMNESERRIPVQYAKRVVGRKQIGGQNSYLPIKIAMSGVMPIIFAMSVMALPSTLEMFRAPAAQPVGFWQNFYAGFINFFKYTSPWYALIYFLLIIAFNFFYVSMQFDPVKLSNQLRNSNGGIPGIRPGKPTADYIRKVMNKITIVGAFFLGVIAIVPILSNLFISGLNVAMGGTTVLILVSVVLETGRTLQSQMMMRHHRGFLE